MTKFNIVKILASVISAFSIISNTSAAALKIGSIDMEVVFQGYYKTIQTDETLRKQREIFEEYAINLEKEREQLEEQFNSLRDISQNIALSDDVREEKRNEAQTKFMLLQEKEKEIKEYKKDKQLGIRRQFEEERNKIVKEILDFVRVIAEQQEYDMIFDSSGSTLNGIPAFVYLNADYDFTEDILTQLNKGHEDELLGGSGEKE